MLPPYPNTILLLFLSATRRLNLKYVSPPAHPQPETVSLGAATQNTYLFCSPQLHDTKYFDPSLSQFSPKICRFCFPQLVDQKSSGLVVRFPQPQESKTIHVLFPLVSRNKMFQSFPQPVCTKNMQISFPSPLSTKIICATLPSASGFKNHTCFCFS